MPWCLSIGECPRNLQFLFTDDTATWRVSAAQHNAHFQRQLRNLGVASALHATWAQRRWSCRFIGSNTAICHSCDAGGGGPLKGPLKDAFKKAHFHFTKTGSPKQFQTGSRALAELAPRFSAEQDIRARRQLLQSHHIETEGVEEQQRRRATELCPQPSRLSERYLCLSVMWDANKK